MPKIEKKHAQGFGTGYLYTLLVALKDDLAAQKAIIDDIKDKYEDHRHSVAGGEGTGTKPSTGGATADPTASIIIDKKDLTVTS
ncbi:MAG TPA: hypothetical protein ENN27_00535 [Candidatus Atribacteria bacterium]|nr:hypothetical protein [Candidatus Atribacteria bacterium]